MFCLSHFVFISLHFFFFLLKYNTHPTSCCVNVGEPCVCIVSHYSKRKRVCALICSGRKQNSNFIPICCAEQSFHHGLGFKSKDAKQLRVGKKKTNTNKTSSQKVFFFFCACCRRFLRVKASVIGVNGVGLLICHLLSKECLPRPCLIILFRSDKGEKNERNKTASAAN